MNIDPFVEDTKDLYGYCFQNPVYYAEIDGEMPIPYWILELMWAGTAAHSYLTSAARAGSFGPGWEPNYINTGGIADLVHEYDNNEIKKEVWELKPISNMIGPSYAAAQRQLTRYVVNISNNIAFFNGGNSNVSSGSSNGGPLPFKTFNGVISTMLMVYDVTYTIPIGTDGMIYYELRNPRLNPITQRVTSTIALAFVVAAAVKLAVPSGGSVLKPAFATAAVLMTTIATAQSIDTTPQITPIDLNNLSPINDSFMPSPIIFSSSTSSSSSPVSIESEGGGAKVSRSPRFQ